jgi:hypothetical protein
MPFHRSLVAGFIHKYAKKQEEEAERESMALEKGLLGGYLGYKSMYEGLPMVLGKERALHMTIPENAASIKRTGLDPSYSKGGLAESVLEKIKSGEISPADAERHRQAAEFAKGRSFVAPSTWRSRWDPTIRSMKRLSGIDYTRNVWEKGLEPEVLNLNLDYDKFKRMETDPYFRVRGIDFPHKEMAAATKEMIHPREIAESSVPMSERAMETMRRLPGYIRDNPGRFAAGLALTGGGAWLAGKSLKKIKDNLFRKEEEKQASKKDEEEEPSAGNALFNLLAGSTVATLGTQPLLGFRRVYHGAPDSARLDIFAGGAIKRPDQFLDKDQIRARYGPRKAFRGQQGHTYFSRHPFVARGYAGDSGPVMTADLPHETYERSKLNPDFGTQYIREDIPLSLVHETPSGSKGVWKGTMERLPEYIKKNPLRFAGGLAATVGGTYLASRGAKELYQKLVGKKREDEPEKKAVNLKELQKKNEELRKKKEQLKGVVSKLKSGVDATRKANVEIMKPRVNPSLRIKGDPRNITPS